MGLLVQRGPGSPSRLQLRIAPSSPALTMSGAPRCSPPPPPCLLPPSPDHRQRVDRPGVGCRDDGVQFTAQSASADELERQIAVNRRVQPSRAVPSRWRRSAATICAARDPVLPVDWENAWTTATLVARAAVSARGGMRVNARRRAPCRHAGGPWQIQVGSPRPAPTRCEGSCAAHAGVGLTRKVEQLLQPDRRSHHAHAKWKELIDDNDRPHGRHALGAVESMPAGSKRVSRVVCDPWEGGWRLTALIFRTGTPLDRPGRPEGPAHSREHRLRDSAEPLEFLIAHRPDRESALACPPAPAATAVGAGKEWAVSVAHVREQVAEDFVGGGYAWAPVTGSSCLISGTGKPCSWAIPRMEKRSDRPSMPRGASSGTTVSGISGTGRGMISGQSSWARGESRVKMPEKLRALASRAVSGCPEVPALAHRRQQRSRAELVVDDGALRDPCGDCQRRDPHARAVERKPHLPCRRPCRPAGRAGGGGTWS